MSSLNSFKRFRLVVRIQAVTLALVLFASADAAHAQVAKDTPFGTELVFANFPNSTAQDMANALAVSAAVGSHSCFTWHWGDVNSPRSVVESLPPLLRQFGLKSMIQIGATFLGNPGVPPEYVPSFGDPAVRARYLQDITAIAQAHPDYIVLTTEANLMYRFNNPEFQNFRTLYTEAYNAVKLVSPNTKVGASYLYALWFLDYVVNGLDVPALLAPSDFIAFTTYPEWLVREGHYASIADIPPEFHGQARVAYPNASIVFSEVGWASKGRGTPELQVEFVRNLPRMLSTVQPELVTWALLYDVEFFQPSLLSPEATQFLINLGVDIDSLFEHFNGMGLLRGDGVAKPALVDALELDFSTP
jgi:hypothetical protein